MNAIRRKSVDFDEIVENAAHTVEISITIIHPVQSHTHHYEILLQRIFTCSFKFYVLSSNYDFYSILQMKVEVETKSEMRYTKPIRILKQFTAHILHCFVCDFHN